ncbi:DUF86 domain-containing protein [Candidatus Daviesbacteria bacterium]|nr:DUF86 domain-containing protein [Candidatus Daviesbacteria bacterium]
MAISIETIKNLLEYLDAEIRIIEKSQVTREELDEKENIDFTDATKRRMQVAVEIVINLAEHIVAGLNLGKPEFARELFPMLVKEGIIEKELSEKLQKAVGLRNILVHMYRDVDLNILADCATAGLDDLRELAKAIYEFLEKNSKEN